MGVCFFSNSSRISISVYVTVLELGLSFLTSSFATSVAVGGYGSTEAMGEMIADLETFEQASADGSVVNRIFYFAIPPDVFLDTAASIKAVGMSATGFTRLVVEKPFGHDYESALQVRVSDTLECFVCRCWLRPHWSAIDNMTT